MRSEGEAAERRAALGRPLFVAAILTGSFLLFLVQPMVARMALPRLGGAPAVWNSAMLIYQALLLAGYAYAHALGRLTPRAQAVVHLSVLLLAAIWLPIGLSTMAQPATLSPALFVPALLAASIGPLFFAVAAQAPLMQRWFALGRPGADPYWLYAASNLGSFGGLVAYPLLVEPNLTLAGQSALWSGGYLLLVLLVLACALTLRGNPATPAIAGNDERGAPIAKDWLRWIALAAVPSGLMLSTTTHLTTDIVAMPLIWVIPLGLYLLSFSVAFASGRRLARWIAAPFPVAIIIAAELAFSGFKLHPAVPALIDLALLFVVAVALHARMYETRPATRHLTAFYLAMSIGGVVGGLFCALIAPIVFDWVYEHPILIVVAAALLPMKPLFGVIARINADPDRGRRLARWLAVAGLLLSLLPGGMLAGDMSQGAVLALVALLALIAAATVGHRFAFAVAVAAVMLGGGGWSTLKLSASQTARTRSYFGIYTVGMRYENGGAERMLVHGTTLHGVQRQEPGRELYETSYYAPRSGVGLAARAVPALYGPHARIGLVGLGAGTLACYRRPGQHWTIYEIDPAIVRIARETGGFTFLRRCVPDARIEIGDARLSLAAARPGSLDLLMVDAFSSDAVPMHLLTREALAIYRRVLSPSGLLLVHISNRYFDLEPVLSAGAAETGLYTSLRDYRPTKAEERAGATRSIWVALSADKRPLEILLAMQRDGWRAPQTRPGFAAWTDDYASVLPLLRFPNR